MSSDYVFTTAGDHERVVFIDGSMLDWWPSTGTVRVTGKVKDGAASKVDTRVKYKTKADLVKALAGHHTTAPTEGLCADGAKSSSTNYAEAQVTDVYGKRIDYLKIEGATNNYAELVALGLAIYHAEKLNEHIVWFDSMVAYSWVTKGRVGANVKNAHRVNMMITRIRKMLGHIEDSGYKIEFRHWDKAKWGEIPADFGNK